MVIVGGCRDRGTKGKKNVDFFEVNNNNKKPTTKLTPKTTFMHMYTQMHTYDCVSS